VTVGVHHVVQPVGGAGHRIRATCLSRWNVAVKQEIVCWRDVISRVDQLLNRLSISLVHEAFKLIAVGSESRSPHEVSHQCDIFVAFHEKPPTM
jgi:hypothetical protein